MVHVPYKGDAPASIDLIAGRVQLSICTLSTGLLPQVATGRVRVLATMLPSRSPLLPETPTAAEAGLRLAISPWGGLFGPPGLPRELVDRIAVEMRSAAGRSDVREALDKIAFEVQASTPAEMAGVLADQLDIWRRTVQELGIERN